jgi:predicted nucleic acid-binding protein
VIYFDTAYIAKCYLNEHGSDEVRRLAVREGRIACCEFGRLELAASIHRNLRDCVITRAQYRVILKQFDSDEANQIWTWLPVATELLARAATAFRRLKPDVYLRSADALHLACAAEHGFREIWSDDRRLLDGARRFKIKGRNVIGPIR